MGHFIGGWDDFGAAAGGAALAGGEAVGLADEGAACAGSDWGGDTVWWEGGCIIT